MGSRLADRCLGPYWSDVGGVWRLQNRKKTAAHFCTGLTLGRVESGQPSGSPSIAGAGRAESLSRVHTPQFKAACLSERVPAFFAGRDGTCGPRPAQASQGLTGDTPSLLGLLPMWHGVRLKPRARGCGPDFRRVHGPPSAGSARPAGCQPRKNSRQCVASARADRQASIVQPITAHNRGLLGSDRREGPPHCAPTSALCWRLLGCSGFRQRSNLLAHWGRQRANAIGNEMRKRRRHESAGGGSHPRPAARRIGTSGPHPARGEADGKPATLLSRCNLN